MSNHVFPDLLGISIEQTKTPTWESTVQQSVSGCSVALTAYTYPLWRYSLRFDFLRSDSLAELQAVVGFFNKHYGRTDTWLYYDDEDNTAADEVMGVGDGTNKQFWLARAYGGFFEPVTDAKTIDSITVNGAPVPYTAGNGGSITLASAPGVGATVRWSGTFYRRCRFVDDVMDVDRFLWKLWKAGKVDFITAKVRPS